MNAVHRPPARQTDAPDRAYKRSSEPRSQGHLHLARRTLSAAVVTLHVVVLLGAVIVPAYAVATAVAGAFSEAHPAELVALDRWLDLLGHTAAVCGVALLTTLAIGLTGGLALTRTDMPGKTPFMALAVLGACVPVYVVAVFIFSYLPASRLVGSSIACGVIYGLIYSPLAVVVLGATFRCADRELEDLASLDAPPRIVLLRVTIPQASWGIATFAILLILLVGTDFTITDTLFVRTFAEEVYTQFGLHHSAAGPVLTSLPILLTLAVLFVAVQRHYGLLGQHSPWQFGEPPRTFALGRWRPVVPIIAAALVLALVGPPVTSLLQKIGSWQGFSGAAAALKRELVVSALLAILGATVVVLPAVGLSWVLSRGGGLRVLVASAAVLLLALPAPVVGISLVGLLDRPGLPGMVYDSPVVIAIGYVVRFLPIGVLLLVTAVQRVPRDLESAARVDGCDWLAVQWHVFWPAVATEALVVWLVVVILCFADVGTTMLLAPPGWETASVRAFTLMHFGVYRDLAVLAVLAAACILAPWICLVILLRRRLARPGTRSVA